MTQYCFLVIAFQMFKGFEKIQDVQYIYTPFDSSLCGVKLEANSQKQYLLTGKLKTSKWPSESLSPEDSQGRARAVLGQQAEPGGISLGIKQCCVTKRQTELGGALAISLSIQEPSLQSSWPPLHCYFRNWLLSQPRTTGSIISFN